MRKGIHPDYVEAKVHCSCGADFMTHATVPELHVEICSECHPFYTGKQKFVDTGGRVQRFADKFGNTADKVTQKAAAEKEARQKAAEEAAEVARAARGQKDGRKAEKAAKHEVAEATKAGDADAAGDTAPEPETEGDGGEE